MLTVTNRSLSDQAFNIVGGATEILAPGESRDLDVADPESPQNVGRLHAGAIVFGEAKPVEPAPASGDKDAPAAEALQPERRP